VEGYLVPVIAMTIESRKIIPSSLIQQHPLINSKAGEDDNEQSMEVAADGSGGGYWGKKSIGDVDLDEQNTREEAVTLTFDGAIESLDIDNFFIVGTKADSPIQNARLKLDRVVLKKLESSG